MSLILIFASNLRNLRIARGYSQEKLAEVVDLHRTYISGLERGTRNISIRNIEKIALALGVSPVDLLTESDDMNSPAS
jgi:transcriptional regulator with XRE-family HTH domain